MRARWKRLYSGGLKYDQWPVQDKCRLHLPWIDQIKNRVTP